jgi:hypothetical protein
MEAAGAKLPEEGKIRLACGWPSKGGVAPDPSKSHSLGQTWSPNATEDGTIQIFITPRLAEGVEVLGVLAHELIHAATPEAKHRGPFKRIAIALGLEGKMTSTSPGEVLLARLKEIAEKLGGYPNAAIKPSYKPKVQSTRMLKATCPACGFLIRGAKKHFKKGMPICYCGESFILEDPTLLGGDDDGAEEKE